MNALYLLGKGKGEAMKKIEKELEEKKKRLEELVQSRSKANCIDVNSSPSAVSHEMKIEELEDEIRELQKKV